MENSIKILKQIESTHRGLGISILFGLISLLGKVSVIFIGEKGMGKSTTIGMIKGVGILPSLDVSIDNLTLTELANQNQFSACYNQKMLWRIKEWSTMNRYNRELFTTMASKIITEKEYYHWMGEKKSKDGVKIPIVIDIKNSDLMVFVGIQPLKMSRLMRENENWESLTSDRFIKYVMLNALRQDSVETPPKYDIPEITDMNIIPEFKTDLKMTKTILHNQISPERVPLFAKHLLTGFAVLENKTEITIRDELNFQRLFRHFIQLYPNIIYSRDIAEESELAVGSMRLFTQIVKNNGISIDTLEETFSVYNVKKKPQDANRPLENAKEMINRHSELLTNRGLISVIDNSPRKFYMSKPFETYWTWYSDLTK